MRPQPTFASLAWAANGKVTRRAQFRRKLDGVVPWDRLVA